MTNEQRLGERLKELIDVVGITQTALAQKLGLTQGYMNQVFVGKKRISATIIFEIAIGFTDLNLNWLIRGTGDMFLIEGTATAPISVSMVEEAPAVYLARRSGILEDMQERIADLEATVAKMKAKK